MTDQQIKKPNNINFVLFILLSGSKRLDIIFTSSVTCPPAPKLLVVIVVSGYQLKGVLGVVLTTDRCKINHKRSVGAFL